MRPGGWCTPVASAGTVSGRYSRRPRGLQRRYGVSALIASLAIDLGVKVNILGADTRNIEGRAFGTMLLGLPDDPNEAAKALSYIRAQPMSLRRRWNTMFESIAAFWAEYGNVLTDGVWDTLVMVVISTAFAYLIGLPLGVA